MSSSDAPPSIIADGERDEPDTEAGTAEAPLPSDDAAPDAEDDRWRRFADSEARPEPPATTTTTRGRRLAARTWRILRHEWTIVALISLALAGLMNWQVLLDPANTIPHDLGDPLQQAYTLSWPGHILFTDPAALWNANYFYPSTHSFAFTDTLLGYAPAAVFGSGPEAALVRYNLLYVLSFAGAFFGGYALLRQLGARIAGSAVAAAAFAFAPWKLAHGGHLNILSIGGIALALAMLARGHGYSMRHGYRRERTRWGWIVAGWLVAAWQVSLGFALGIGFGYLLAGIAVVSTIVWLVKRVAPLPWRVVVADIGGMLVFAAVSLGLSVPYFRVLADHPEAERTLDYVDMFSPGWMSFFISPPESSLWGQAHAPAREGMVWHQETSLLVGFTVLALALAGLVWSSWSRRQRWFLAMGILVTVALAMGTNFIDDGAWAYALAFEYLPGFDALRTPGRLVLYTTLLLAILAAGTLTHLADRMDRHAAEGRVDVRWQLRVPAPLRAALFLPLLLVLAEGYSSDEVPEVPDSPVAMSTLEDPVLVLPSDGSHDFAAQYWSVDGFPRMVNGTAGFVPTSQEEIRRDAYTFPSKDSVAALREAGINTVVVVRDQLEGTPWEQLLDVPRADASVKVSDLGPVVVFEL